jgi:hypothetical protein
MTWAKISLPIKVILAAESIALYHALSKRNHTSALVTAMFGAGILLGEWQTQKNAASGNPSTATATRLAALRLV